MNDNLTTQSSTKKTPIESIAKRVKTQRFAVKESEKRRIKSKQTKEEILVLATEQIKQTLGMDNIPIEKIKTLLERNQFNISKALLRLQTNPQYYRKSFA